MAKKKSVEDLYQAIFAIRESLQDAVQLASEAALVAEAFGGEISRTLTEQLNSYFIPSITKYIDDTETPGAVAPLISFLDSVPLAMTREEPSPEQTTPAPIENPQLVAPPSGPAPESFAGQGAAPKTPVMEKRSWRNSSMMEAALKTADIMKESLENWSVFRVNRETNKATEVVGNLTEHAAKKRVEVLNEGVAALDMFMYEARKAENTPKPNAGVQKKEPMKEASSTADNMRDAARFIRSLHKKGRSISEILDALDGQVRWADSFTEEEVEDIINGESMKESLEDWIAEDSSTSRDEFGQPIESANDLTEAERVQIEDLVVDGWDYEDAYDYVVNR